MARTVFLADTSVYVLPGRQVTDHMSRDRRAQRSLRLGLRLSVGAAPRSPDARNPSKRPCKRLPGYLGRRRTVAR